ncbi:hypothetical protein BUALT_Bualt14G0062600 [Buddleja alternifolia]|uniref:Polygalacturonase n=1 Tax=Buddleja alternifolia TaxID=168488 RepID=A0AAV6WFF3_9LAMI|nr:hypothetical protein BUALT_Bualt14G0062600 [Buddleja alternifolia]
MIQILILTYFYCSSPSLAANPTFNVQTFGAKSDGKSDCTNAFLSAWGAACAAPKPATIYVPRGKYLLRNAYFNGRLCKNTAITMRIDGTLVAPSDYNVIAKSGSWLRFERVTGVSIYGGTLDAQGTKLWACKNSGKSCPKGARSLAFYNSKNIIVNGLTSLNSQTFHVLFDRCQNAKIVNMKITAPGNSPNTDGIHLERSSGVSIMNSHIGTGDDCVSIGPGNSNLWIENISCGPGHGISAAAQIMTMPRHSAAAQIKTMPRHSAAAQKCRLSQTRLLTLVMMIQRVFDDSTRIGSLGWDLQEAGVQNVTVKTVTFTGTDNGLRIKTWARPSNGFVRGVLFQDAAMVNVRNPIIIDQNYCPHHKNCPDQASGVRISNVKYQDIHGTSSTQVAVKFDCSKTHPCSGIRLDKINLTYRGKAATAFCANAGGTATRVVEPTSCL